MAFNIIDRQNIIFVQTAVYPVGREDWINDFTSYDENLLSENSAKTPFRED